MSRQQMITLAPRLARSMAVSLPMPVFAPEKLIKINLHYFLYLHSLATTLIIRHLYVQ